MKFKVLEGTETYEKFQELFKLDKEVTSLAYEIVKECGATKYSPCRWSLYGGISGIVFDEKPKGWKIANKELSTFYPMDIDKNKELRDRIQNLPTVDFEQLNKIIGIELNPFSHIGYIKKKDFILIDTDDHDYTPIPDLIEILESEYKRLSETK